LSTDARRGKGSKFYIGADDTTSLTTNDAVAQIKGSIMLPSRETEKIDVTNHDSPRNSKEFIPGDDDVGTFDITLVFKETEYQRLEGRRNKLLKMRICLINTDGTFTGTLPNTTPRCDFLGYISKIEAEAPTDKEVTAKVTIQAATAPAMTYSS
jgi:hypothetical protein